MRKDGNLTYTAIITLVGTVIGVGIFSVPYALSQVGLGLALTYLFVLTMVQLLQHLFYAEAAIACPDQLRLVGLARRYLGPRASTVAACSMVLGYWGAILAYVIVGGTFLHALLGPSFGGTPLTYQVLWPATGATIVYFGLTVVASINGVATLALLAALGAIFFLGAPHVETANLLAPVAVRDPFVPYGVVLFSLSGLPAVLEMEDILRGKHRSYRFAVVAGTLVAAALTAAFGLLVWGVSGSATTPDAVTGLRSALGGGVATLCALFGFLAVATSYFATAINLQNTFEYDFKLPRFAAWALTSGVPLTLFLLGANNFVGVVSFTGAVFGGITSIVVAMLYVAVTKAHAVTRRDKRLGIPTWMAWVVVAMLSIGALIEVVSLAA